MKYKYDQLYGAYTFISDDNEEITKVQRVESPSEEYDTIYEGLGLNSFTDYTCELGARYKYKINDKEYDVSKDKIYFENIVICDSETNSLIRFNPKISSLKYNQQESTTVTLGGQYPIVRRNGNTGYYSFQIEGLISLRALDENCMIENDGRDEYMLESEFRKSFLKSITNGRIKLFKSAEGIRLVRISNVNLTPEEKLSRLVYTFSATVTEIAEATIQNCQTYKIFSTTNTTEFITSRGIPFYVKNEG